MRKFAFAALATMTVATPAMAEDGSWTGGYGGITAGYNVSKSDSAVTLGGAWTTSAAALQTLVVSNMSVKQQTKGGDIGIALGYQYQTGGVVFGLEAEAAAIGGNAVRSSGTVTYSAAQNFKFTNTIDPKTMIALKARLGGVVGENTLIYLNGGWAWVSANHAATVTASELTGLGLLANGNYLKQGLTSKTHNGFIIGGGVEHRISNNFSLRLQYDYTDQGDVSYPTTYLPTSLNTTPAYSETVSQNLRVHLIRVGFNYHF